MLKVARRTGRFLQLVGPKPHTSRRAIARTTCGTSNRLRRPSGSSRSTTSCATCSPLDGIGFAPAISDFCVRVRSLRGTPWQWPDASALRRRPTCAVVGVNLTVPFRLRRGGTSCFLPANPRRHDLPVRVVLGCKLPPSAARVPRPPRGETRNQLRSRPLRLALVQKRVDAFLEVGAHVAHLDEIRVALLGAARVQQAPRHLLRGADRQRRV